MELILLITIGFAYQRRFAGRTLGGEVLDKQNVLGVRPRYQCEMGCS